MSGGIGWSRLLGRWDDSRPYKESLAPLDEALAHLLAERERMGGEDPGVPGADRLQALAHTCQADPILLEQVFRLLDRRPWRRVPRLLPSRENFVPRAVLPIMRAVHLKNARCTLTHALQLGEASEVHMHVTLERVGDAPLAARLAVELLVEGPQPYETIAWGGGGGGHRYERRFAVTPELPDDLAGIRFLLVPGQELEHPQVVDVTVDAPTPFVEP